MRNWRLKLSLEQILAGDPPEPGWDMGDEASTTQPDTPQDVLLSRAIGLLVGQDEARPFWLDTLAQPWLFGGQGFSRIHGLDHVLTAMIVHLWAREHRDAILEQVARRWLRAVFTLYVLSAVDTGPYGLTVTATGDSSWNPDCSTGLPNLALDSIVSAAIHSREPLIAGRWESACIGCLRRRLCPSPFDFLADSTSVLRRVMRNEWDDASLDQLEDLLRPLRLESPLIIQRRTGGVATLREWTPRVEAGRIPYLQALVGLAGDSVRLTALALNDGGSTSPPAETWVERDFIWARHVDGSAPSPQGERELASNRHYGIRLPAGELELVVRLDQTGVRLQPSARCPKSRTSV